MKVQTRKATMTNKQRVEALLRRERPDRVPFWCFGGGAFAMLYSGYSLAEMYTCGPKVVYEADKKTCQDFDWVFMPTFAANRVGRPFGGEVKLPTSKYSQASFVVKYPVDTPEDAMALKIPDVKASITPEVREYYKISSQDKDDNKAFNFSFGAGGVFNTVADIIGPEKLCRWILKEPEATHHLLRVVTDYLVAVAQYYKDTFGVERVLPSGSSPHASNQLISPKHFEQFALPYYREVYQKVLAMGYKHIQHHPCGEQNKNLPYYQQIPVGDPGTWLIGDEIELETMAKYFPNDIIAGNMNTTIIQNGSPDEVYEAARKLIERGKSLATGYILTPACTLPPLAPVENMRAITRALNDFGWYD